MVVRVFLVEDNPTIRDGLMETLSELLDVRWAGWAPDEAGAIASMRAVPWDIALVDLFLEAGSGIGVALAFESRGAAKLFVLTNYATPGMRERCTEAGVDAVFDKSVELDALLAAIEDVDAAGDP